MPRNGTRGEGREKTLQQKSSLSLPGLPKINDLRGDPTVRSGGDVLMELSHASTWDGYRS